MINKGRIGVGKNATVNFTGKKWENDPSSLLTDESNAGAGINGEGGWIRFMSDTMRQQVSGGYNAATRLGPTFARLKIQNPLGIELLDGSAAVRNEVYFQKGLFYLNDNILVMGNRDPGILTGYDSTRYFVTGNKPNSGLLIRKNLRSQDGTVVFPVGSYAGSYTPAALKSLSSRGRDFYVSVFDGVRSNGGSGTGILSESVNKSWQIGRTGYDFVGQLEMTLQHLIKDEGASFAANRKNAYISEYKSFGWDKGDPQSTPVDGYLTTAVTLRGSGVNKRLFGGNITGNSYFTKFTGDGRSSVLTSLWFNAYRLDTALVKVYWRTRPEINIQSFIVQRKLANEAGFKDVGTVNSMAPGGYSQTLLNYTMNDPNNYKGISFYRLMLIHYSGVNTFSDTVAVGSIPGIYSIMLWPNPTPNQFFISIHKTLPAKSIIIFNVLGQKLKEEYVNGRNIIQMGGLIPGTYFVSIVLITGEIIETKKLIVAGK